MNAAYVNVHGEAVNVSARDAVVAIHAGAVAKRGLLMLRGGGWVVRRSAHPMAAIIGTGANEEAAWRDAWSRMLAVEVAKEGKGCAA